MHLTKTEIRGYYWRETAIVKNLGDHLAALVLDALGYRCVSQDYPEPQVLNPGRCLLSIGSVLSKRTFERIVTPVDVWGSGWRGIPLPPDTLRRVRFHAVRGPRTQSGLGLPVDTPLGDPALLLPRLRNDVIEHHDLTMVIPHFYRTYQMSAEQRCSLTGCDAILPMRVIGAPTPGARISAKGLPGMIGAWMRLGIPIQKPWQAIRQIAGARFVLTGSLHGAILAQAYGVPWAAYDDGYVDVPEKWFDWAEYVGIRIRFVPDLQTGMAWWDTNGRAGKVGDLTQLLAAFPYPHS